MSSPTGVGPRRYQFDSSVAALVLTRTAGSLSLDQGSRDAPKKTARVFQGCSWGGGADVPVRRREPPDSGGSAVVAPSAGTPHESEDNNADGPNEATFCGLFRGIPCRDRRHSRAGLWEGNELPVRCRREPDP